MGKFTHYLVTRFNVPFSGPAPEFFSGSTLSSEWMKQRIRLFAEYCAPSVAGQSSMDFTWLVYLDPDTDRTDIVRVRAAIPANVRVEFRYVSDYAMLLDDLRAYCRACGTEYVITSRLDNDDAIGREFIERIQAAFQPSHGVILNFLGGLYYDPSARLLTHHRHKLRNSFTSLVERLAPGESPCTILGFPHLQPPADFREVNLPYPFSFWINLHGANESYRRPHGWPVFTKAVVSQFGFSPALVRLSWPATLIYTLRWLPRAIYRKVRYKIRRSSHGTA
jgi:hypothetical protein